MHVFMTRPTLPRRPRQEEGTASHVSRLMDKPIMVDTFSSTFEMYRYRSPVKRAKLIRASGS
jgi:hypothetical protein